MKRKKIFKILSVIVCLIMISALFLVPVSADNHNDVVVSQVMYSGSSQSFYFQDLFSSNYNDDIRFYHVNSRYSNLNFHFSPIEQFVTGDVVNISGTIFLEKNVSNITLRETSDYYSSKNLKSSLRSFSLDGEEIQVLDFKYSYVFSSGRATDFFFSVTASSSISWFAVGNLKFYLNNDPSISAQAQTDALKQNQDKNTDKLLNGGHSSAPYGSTDKSSLEQNDELSSDVDSATLEARSSTISFFNNFSSLITSSGGLHRGLLAISKVFNEFFSISWLSNIVKFGLAIGSFAFVIGSVSMIVGRVSSDKSSTQRKTKYDRNVSRRK